jgi:hypothetical protein
MEKVRAVLMGAVSLAGLCLMATPAVADDRLMFGARVSYFTEADAASLGVELLVPIAHRVYFNPNFEYVFVTDASYWTLNADFHYDFPTHSSAYVWLGGGVALVHVDPEGPAPSDTDVGANFIGGVGFRAGSVIPYFQAKLIAKSDTEFAVAFGFRF